MAGFSILYGFGQRTLNDVKVIVESALGVDLQPHESFYRGGEYYRWADEDAELVLQRNYDPLDEDYAETDYPHMAILLYLDAKGRASDLAKKLIEGAPQAALLRRIDY